MRGCVTIIFNEMCEYSCSRLAFKTASLLWVDRKIKIATRLLLGSYMKRFCVGKYAVHVKVDGCIV
jgi:hypothetical protein